MSKKKTHEEFVTEVYNLVGNEYSVLGIYNGNKKHVLIKHNNENCNNYEWGINPTAFLRGNGCPACAGNKKYTLDEIKEYIKGLNYELISKDYKNNNQKLILKDKDGYYYYISFDCLKRGSIPNKFHKANPYTIQNIKLWCKLNNKPFELVSNIYIDSDKNNLKWKCLKDGCNEIFEMSWTNIHTGQGCSVCRGIQIGLSNCLAIKNPKLANEWHPILNGDLTPYNVTCGNSKLDIWWQCEKGHEWTAKINSRNDGNGCPYCTGQLPSKDYNLLVINPKLCEEWDYEKNDKRPEEYTPGSGEYAWWICKECGHKWYAQIASRNKSNGCPECCKSKGEKKIDEILINNNLVKLSQEELDQLIDENKYNKNYFIPQKEFDNLIGLGGGLLSYDFYIPKYTFLCEFQGIQHEKYIPGFHKSYDDFLKQLEHDKRKREYAQIHNINLLEIWYYDFDRIEEILSKKLNFNIEKNIL